MNGTFIERLSRRRGVVRSDRSNLTVADNSGAVFEEFLVTAIEEAESVFSNRPEDFLLSTPYDEDEMEARPFSRRGTRSEQRSKSPQHSTAENGLTGLEVDVAC